MLGVATQNFIGALAGQHHLDRLARFLGQQIDGNIGRLGHRRVAKAHQVGQQGDHLVDRYFQFMVIGGKLARDIGRIRQFAETALLEADRKSFHGHAGMARHQGHHRRGIDAAGQKGAERHIRNHADAHRFVEFFQESGDRVGRQAACHARPAVGRRVIHVLAQHAVFPGGGRTGREFADAVEQGGRTGRIAVSEIIPDGVFVGLRAHAGQGQQRLDFGAESEPAFVLPQEQRLLAERVARHEQAIIARIPDGERKHAAKVPHAILAPLHVGVDDGFGIGSGAETVAQRDQLLAQWLVIVDFAIEDDLHVARLVAQRLVAGSDIDNRQAPVQQAHLPRTVGGGGLQHAGVIRAAVRDGAPHGLERGQLAGVGRGKDQTGNTAHNISLEKNYSDTGGASMAR